MNSDLFDLSQVVFTRRTDVVNPGKTIFNPEYSTVRTLRGHDQIIGSSSVSYDLGVSLKVAAEDIGLGLNPVNSAEFINQRKHYVDGIINKGELYTNKGRDIVNGSATAKVTAVAQTVSEAIAIANTVDATAIANSVAFAEIAAIANGINNSGKISTGLGSDTVSGELKAAVAAVATASIDVKAIANAVAQTPMSEGLKAIAAGFAISIAKAQVVATGINNQHGEIRTGDGADYISATATSYSASFAEAETSAFAIATPENQALFQAVVAAIAQTQDTAIAINNQYGDIRTGYGADQIDATANASDNAIGIYNKYGYIATGYGSDTINATANASGNAIGIYNNYGYITTGYGSDTINATANASNYAIAIDNNYGYITTGYGSDTINATANASGNAIAIDNQYGEIITGYGADTIEAYATGSQSYGIYGGNIATGYGNDVLKASSFGGGVNINMGYGADYVEGFGDATVYGGEDFDTLSLGSHNKSDFNIYTNNGFIVFELGGISMETSGFEKYTFADGNYYSNNLIA